MNFFFLNYHLQLGVPIYNVTIKTLGKNSDSQFLSPTLKGEAKTINIQFFIYLIKSIKRINGNIKKIYYLLNDEGFFKKPISNLNFGNMICKERP